MTASLKLLSDVLPLPQTAKAILRVGARALVVRKVNGVWDLPGGRCEPGEDLAQTMVREFYEETGQLMPPCAPAGFWLKERPGRTDLMIHFFLADVEAGFIAGVRLSDEHDQQMLADLEQVRGLNLPEGYRRALVDVLTPVA